MHQEDELPTEILPEGVTSAVALSAAESEGRLLTVRRSPISTARYNRWVVGERNRGFGQELRVQVEVLRTAKREAEESHRVHGAKLIQQGHVQMEKNIDQVEQIREQNIQKALRVRAESLARKQLELQQRQQYFARGRELAIAVRQQKERVRRVTGEKCARVAEITAAAKEEEAEFETSLRVVREQLQALKRSRAAGVRAATTDTVLDGAKYIYERRREVANSTRSAQQTLREERRVEERSHLAKARANKAAAEASRKKAKELRAGLEAARRADATATRERHRRVKAEKEKAIVFASGGLRDRHDAVYRDRFVTETEADAMVASGFAETV